MPEPTRRQFLIGTATTSAVSVLINYVHFGCSNPTRAPSDENNWMAGPARARFRYDGLAKVRGEKIFACDFRARDMKGWPVPECRVVVLKAGRIDRRFVTVNVDKLGRNAKPFKVVTSKDLAEHELRSPRFYERNLLVERGQGPDYFGQPVALLYFDLENYLAAAPLLGNADDLIEYGEPAPPPPVATFIHQRIVKYKEGDRLLFSAHTDGGPASDDNANAAYYSERIGKRLETGGWQVFTAAYKTQAIEPAAMEAENGLCWYDAKTQSCKILIGTQSPDADARFVAQLFSDSRFPLKSVELNACYMGGAFGGRDHSPFVVFLAAAAALSEGRSVRIANTRFEQFQFGLKRHSSQINETIAIDDHGSFMALKSDLHFNGGGRRNFTEYVAQVAANNAGSAYVFPLVDVTIRSESSPAVPAGSMRGFGSSQAQFALESLIDEAADRLKVDAIDVRLKNALGPGKDMLSGRVPNARMQVRKVLEMARGHALWKSRGEIRARSTEQVKRGVGFAMALKSFGDTRDAVLAEVAIGRDGSISLATNNLDMGTGIATTLALATAESLGSNASHVALGAIEVFRVLGLISEFCTEQSRLDELAKNPLFTPEIVMSAAASTGAFQHRHVVLEASKMLFLESVWPAARSLWREPSLDIEKCRWTDAGLAYPSLQPLSMARLADYMHDNALAVSAMAHAFYSAAWAEASFQVGGRSVRAPIDALAFKTAKAPYERRERRDVRFPPVSNAHGGNDLFTPCGALCALSIDLKNEAITVDEMHGFLDCGPVIQRQIVEGQFEGAVAMGIGQALYEEFPELAGGPGDGTWNFHRYHLPLAREVPVNTQQLHIVDAPADDHMPKGIAEVVLNPIIPSVTNAIAHATGIRFRELPVTIRKIKQALT